MMLGCSRMQPLDTGTMEKHAHWDQSFLSDDDDQQVRIHFYQNFRHHATVTTTVRVPRTSKPVDDRCPNRKSGEEDGGDRRRYVNLPTCGTDSLVVPQTGAVGAVSLRMDLSPVSPRASTADAAPTDGRPWSTVAEVALSRLLQSGFYHESISSTEARRLLLPHQPGTFLVRPSSSTDPRFLFSLTVRTSGREPIFSNVSSLRRMPNLGIS